MLNPKAIQTTEKNFSSELKTINDRESLEAIRIKYIGRKRGLVTDLFHFLPKLSLSEKKTLAPLLNKLKHNIETKLAEKAKNLSHKNGQNTENTVVRDFSLIDPTIPSKEVNIGHHHPTIQIIDEIKEIFHYLGFSFEDGPEVELDLYNFQKLRLHKDHPARDTQQTYYIDEEILLRTQTSSMQIRYMEGHKPPFRMLFPGRVYRRENLDSTHLPAFYQVEGLIVDKKTTMTDLIGVLDLFVKKMFGKNSKIRIYGHHFPYTEPSIEVEVLHKNGKWLEILGAGMVHPEVLKNCGIDPKVYRGFAFGMGPERIAMLKYGIEDIRLFYSNDISFLEQF